MRICCWMALLLILGVTAWADGFTTYGVESFNRIRETDQIAVIRLAPQQVTLDMFIGIDGIPAGETVTYVLPFWHKPDGFSMEAMTGKDFRKACLAPLHDQFHDDIRRAHRTAAESLTGNYLGAGFFAYAPLTPVGLLGAVLFIPTFGKIGDGFSPYASTTVPGGSADLYQVSNATDLQALLVKANLPARYATVLERYHTAYYAVMKLHGRPAATSMGDSTGVHYHFTHQVSGDAYTYTYPLGTGGAWAKPILLTEVYARCPQGYTLTGAAPTLGKEIDYFYLSDLVRHASDETAANLASGTIDPTTATATMLGLPRYPTTWHRAYFNSNPTDDITLHLAKRPADPLYTLAATWRDADWMPIPFMLLGFVGSLLFSLRFVVRKAWLAAGRPGQFRQYARSYLTVMLAPLLVWLVPMLIGLCISSVSHDDSTWLAGLANVLMLAALLASPFVAILLGRKYLVSADLDLPRGVMKRAVYWSIAWYFLLYPLCWALAAGLDLLVRG